MNEKQSTDHMIKNQNLQRDLEEKNSIIERLSAQFETLKTKLESAEDKKGIAEATQVKMEEKLQRAVEEMKKANDRIAELAKKNNEKQAKLKHLNSSLKQQEQ